MTISRSKGKLIAPKMSPKTPPKKKELQQKLMSLGQPKSTPKKGRK